MDTQTLGAFLLGCVAIVAFLERRRIPDYLTDRAVGGRE